MHTHADTSISFACNCARILFVSFSAPINYSVKLLIPDNDICVHWQIEFHWLMQFDFFERACVCFDYFLCAFSSNESMHFDLIYSTGSAANYRPSSQSTIVYHIPALCIPNENLQSSHLFTHLLLTVKRWPRGGHFILL